jgi:hypothetical protein
MLTVIVSFAGQFFSNYAIAKMQKKAAENGENFQPVSVFQQSVTHSGSARATRQAVTIKAAKYRSSVDLQNLGKIKGVP